MEYDDDDDDQITLHPAWAEALKRLLTEHAIQPGDIVEKSRLVELFGLREPVTAEDQRQFQLKWLNCLTALRNEMLEAHRMDLRVKYGDGAYEVVMPQHQTDLAMKDAVHSVSRSLRAAARRVSFVRLEDLTDSQRKANADAQAKLAMLAGMVRKPLLPK